MNIKNKLISFYFLLTLYFGVQSIFAQETARPDLESLTARIHYLSRTIDVSLPPDFTYTFSTDLGNVRLPLRALKILRLVDVGSPSILIGEGGNRWLVRQPDRLVARILSERNQLSVPSGENLSSHRPQRISFAFSGVPSSLEKNVDQMFVQTVSGQVLQVEARQTHLSLETRHGRQKIPFQRIRQVDLFSRVDVAQPIARVYWKNGFSLEGLLLDRQFKFRDQYGNKLTSRSQRLLRVYRGAIEKNIEKPLTKAQRVDLLFSDGREVELRLDPLVIPFKTARGELYLTSSEILEWEALPRSKNSVLCLIDGSIVIGRPLLSQMNFFTQGNSGETLPIRIKDLQRLVFRSNVLSTLPSALYWNLENSESLRCELKVPSYRLLYQDGLRISEYEIPSSDIQSIILTNYPSIVISTTKRRYTLTPEARTIDVVMPQLQETFSLDWGLVRHVVRQQAGTPSLAVWRAALGLDSSGLAMGEYKEVLIPSASFDMGATRRVGLDDEGPVHPVTLDTFYIDQHEVTVAQFREFIEKKNYRTTAEQQRLPENWSMPGFVQDDKAPATWISWFDAVEFCNWRSKKAGLEPAYYWDKEQRHFECRSETGGYRLPTEAEWEFAARSGGKEKTYPWGEEDELDDVVKLANFQQHRTEAYDNWFWTNPVDQFSPNELGLFGMAGNVWEWCEDWYHPDAYYMIHRAMPKNPVVSHGDAPNLKKRVMRGGSFGNRLDFLRNTSRGSGLPGAVANRVGFRCVRSLPQPAL